MTHRGCSTHRFKAVSPVQEGFLDIHLQITLVYEVFSASILSTPKRCDLNMIAWDSRSHHPSLSTPCCGEPSSTSTDGTNNTRLYHRDLCVRVSTQSSNGVVEAFMKWDVWILPVFNDVLTRSTVLRMMPAIWYSSNDSRQCFSTVIVLDLLEGQRSLTQEMDLSQHFHTQDTSKLYRYWAFFTKD